MKLAVHGPSVRTQGRLRDALVALAERGHRVTWVGAGAPEGAALRVVADGRALAAGDAELVVGEGSALALAWRAWRWHARAGLLAVTAADVARWGFFDRFGWESLHLHALVEEHEGEQLRENARDLPLDRFVLWEGEAAGTTAPSSYDADVLERCGERALAGHAGPVRRPGFFVDRDGTLIVEHGYLGDPAGVELLPGVAEALRQLQAERIPIVVVSNQSGIGRGKFSADDMLRVMARLRVLLRERGVELSAVYACPHAPGGGCACRKPGTLLLEHAAQDQRISLVQSWMVGDKLLDAATGRAMGGTGVLVRTGYGAGEEREAGTSTYGAPDRVYDDLAAAAAAFLASRDALDSV
ncbi:MAG: HAD family hydrolase [Candidatus Eisenbacteria bacterium]